MKTAVCMQVATDIDSETGPMTILARNVSENCGRAAATTQAGSRPDLPRHPAGQGPDPRDTEQRASEPVGEEPRTLPETKDWSSSPPPPRVQGLRWGDGVQLAEALAHFDGFGPDVVLA